MIKKLTCIECPNGCILSVTLENGQIQEITGHTCEKGIAYARSEIEDPLRILTTTVAAKGLELSMIPVRTNKPIPKNKLSEAMKTIRNLQITHAVKAGEVIVKDLLNLNVDLVATRNSS